MTGVNHFSEVQKFRQWWLWFLLAAIKVTLGFFIVTQVLYGTPLGNNDTDSIILLISFFLMLVLSLLFFIMRLETKISSSGISVRFYPFQLKFRHYKWEDLQQVYLREYSPISEYGGWGIRYGDGKAMNVSGRMGLQLVFKDGKKLLIGTSKPDDIGQLLKVLGRT